MAAACTLLNKANPYVAISNTSDHPRYLRKGNIVGELTDPASCLDVPLDEDHSRQLSERATVTKIMVDAAAQADSQRNSSTSPPDVPMQKTNPKDDEQWGPKTAEMPDPTFYSSSDMEDLLDIGQLPDHLKDKAWAMLRRHINAFGFDRRLGHHPSKVHIRTQDGQVPMSMPMYGTSPAKRQVIEEQLNAWFEQGVIEPSQSPWSVPVIIVYRNNKP
ncbi:hypothetical protein EWM64_g8839 [Hericium alpestre]|uniref:Reverse transcriptase domain-containing protein n=1 Tax=Hericium alpestre TaxID=135208 RepID=A0A4Y9ZKQ2_9AGAM|nr:hypothetical protein EWM64_g8839 [Hericium alpestre]